MINRLHCLLFKHDWQNDRHYPIHGYHNTPYLDSYCGRCGKTGKEWLKP